MGCSVQVHMLRHGVFQEVILSTLIDCMDSTSISEPGGRPAPAATAAAAAAASPAPSTVVTSQPSSQKTRDAGRPAAAAAAAAAGPPARVTPPSAGPPAGAGAAAARPGAVPSRLPAARPGRGTPQLRASGLVHHPVGVLTGVRGQRKPPRPAAAAAAAAVDGRPAEPSGH